MNKDLQIGYKPCRFGYFINQKSFFFVRYSKELTAFDLNQNFRHEIFKNNEQGFTIYEVGRNPVDLDTSYIKNRSSLFDI
jgi:hypothetical protein